jgi:hypothetical protein
MKKIIKNLQFYEVTYGLLNIPQKFRDLFPAPSLPVTIIDADGGKYRAKMHAQHSRIDGLTKFHRKHSSQISQRVVIAVDPNEPAIAHVQFTAKAVQEIETAIQKLKPQEIREVGDWLDELRKEL